MTNWKGYMIFKKQQYAWKGLHARLTKTNPKLDVGEVAVKIQVDLPKELFERPMLQANISIPKESIPQSIIDAEIQDNVERVVKEVTGAEIKFSVIENKEEKQDDERNAN